MEWTKSNLSGSELEKQQQAYIKEALEMAKRSVSSQLEKAAEKAAAEKAAAEKAAAEKAAAEKAAAEKAAVEKAAAEKAAAEKAAAEKAAAEKAAAEKAAAEKAIKKEEEKEELTQFAPGIEETEDDCPPTELMPETGKSDEEEIIDIAQIKKENFTVTNAPTAKSVNPPSFNNYINQHNKAQGSCPNCQRKRSGQ